MKTRTSHNRKNLSGSHVCPTPEDTFILGERLGESLAGGEVILLSGNLGAGKTLLTKGILSALDYDVDEVNSPSFTLVNLYRTPRFNVYHIDLWRIDEDADARRAVGLDDITEEENAVCIIEWAERLKNFSLENPIIRVQITGDGDNARNVLIERSEPDENS